MLERRNGGPGLQAHVIPVSPRDDIATICGRVDTAPSQAVVLHVRGENAAFSNELGMRRLSHFARESGKSVAVATHSPVMATLSRRAGLPVSGNPSRVRWDTAPRYVPFTHRRVRVPGQGSVLRLAAIVGLTAFAGVLLLSAAPQGSVTLAPASTTLSTSLLVTASPDRDTIDFQELALPAREVSTRHSLTLAIPTTGKALIGVERAKAEVSITNPGKSAVTVPAGAVLLAGPKYLPFRLPAETQIPAGATVTQSAIAAEPGAQWNVPAKIGWGWVDEGLRTLKVASTKAAAGGTSVERPGIAAADLQRALDQIRALGQAPGLKQRLLDDRPNDLVLLKTATVTVDHDELPEAGTEADVLLIDVSVTIRALAVLAPVLEEFAAQTLPLGERNATLLTGSVSARESVPQPYLGSEGLVRTTVVLRAEVVENFSKDDAKDLIRGKSTSLAQSLLTERYQSARAEVTNWPSWAPFLPRFDFRLRINLVPADAPNTAAPGSDGQ